MYFLLRMTSEVGFGLRSARIYGDNYNRQDGPKTKDKTRR